MPDSRDLNVVLVLQGGGALGAYHVGAYEAMQDAGYAPNWVSGISIGAINAAVLAGNPPERRLARLEQLWDAISRPDYWGAVLPAGPMRKAFNTGSVMMAYLFGQPNFFTPNFPNPGATSFYDTSPMVATLTELCDFGLINAGATRISLGATNVESGQQEFFQNFDSRSSPKRTIGPEHVLASGSLPPGFPYTIVDGQAYWDGGVVSNSPLDAVVDDLPAERTVVFMIDLWSAAGPVPRTMEEVQWRHKQIQYASRTAVDVAKVAEQHNLRYALSEARGRLPVEVRKDLTGSDTVDPEPKLDIVHLKYQPDPDEVSTSAAEFSRPSIARRRAGGYDQMTLALEQEPWFGEEDRLRTSECVVHRVARGTIKSSRRGPARPRPKVTN
ncbi:MAG: patatin-like phospholipase family protein [Acidimicrobiales bacterium]